MAKREKKISVNELDKAIGDIRPVQTEIEWNGLKILVKEMLALDEVSDFVNAATAACFDVDTFSFHPEWRDFVIRAAVVDLYTNLTMPRNPQKVYDILYRTQLFDAIVESINHEQFDDIIGAIHEKIRFFEHNLTAVAGTQMARLANTMEELKSSLGSMMDGVGPDDLRNVVNALANGMDEQKLAQAVLQERSANPDGVA